ncbi:agmatinase [Thalassococcus sp. BH17M4-6]|uniref:agmatinase n=1 Tax=Thalassococcus sp. BH17M4-6 TaxID=3413148 RepID=UPI003BEBB72A
MTNVYSKSTSDWQCRPTFWNRPGVDTGDEIAELGAGVAMIGAPWDGGSSFRPGARFGPRAVRSAVFNPSTHHFHSGVVLKEVLKIVDFGDAYCPVGQPDLALSSIARKVGTALAAGAMPLLIGGDHSVTVPAVRAVVQSEDQDQIGVIQIDAHADTDAEIDGDPLSHGCVIRRLVEDDLIAGDNILQLGLRGFWPPASQMEWAKSHGISWLSVDQAVDEGLLVPALDALRRKVSKVYLTVDLDSLDPAFAPGVGTPEPGGFSTRELFRIIRSICARFQFVGVDVVELVPAHDVADISANTALRTALEILAGIASRRGA